MPARKWFQSVDKFGRWLPSFIFTVIASPPKPLEEFCLEVSARLCFVYKYGRTAAIFKIANCPLLNTETIWLSHLRRDHWSDFKNLPEMIPWWSRCACPKMVQVHQQMWPRQSSLIFIVITSPQKSLEEFC